jgi:signal transduction histidine kinase
MSAAVEALESSERRAGLSVVPAATVTCALLTAWTVLSAVFPAHESVTPCLRSLYTATLYICFLVIRRRSSLPRPLPFRLVEIGFLLLTACFGVGAAVRLFGQSDPEAVARTLMALEQGPGFLLGVSLLCYGIVLLIAELLLQQGRLQRVYAATRGQLVSSEHARRGMEQRLLEAEALRAVGELAAGVAHDLRNPLAIVKAAVDGLEEGAGKEHGEHFAVITRNLARADAAIEALLDVGRTKPAAPAPVLLEEVLGDAADIVARLGEQRGVRVQWQGAAGVTLAVDRAATQRALVNLLSNAIEASEGGGRVVVRARAARRAPAVWLAIADRGVGLPAHRDHLFRPFFTTKPHGTGLGLLTARRIVEAMGGSVRLYPRHRRGARALLRIPTCAAPALRPLAAAGTPS